MFKNLYDDLCKSQIKSKSNNKTYKKVYENNKKTQQNMNSYGQKYRKKNNLLPYKPQLQIIQTDSFIFQGRLSAFVQGNNHYIHHNNINNNKNINNNNNQNNQQIQKHGQGIMFFKNGTLIVGTWDHGILNGRSLIFSPFGGKTTAQFYNGKLSNWSITIFNNKLIICTKYYQNLIDSQKIIYQSTQQMWVISKYTKNTNSFQIIHLQKGSINNLPDLQFILNKKQTGEYDQLIELYDEFIIKGNTGLGIERKQQSKFSQIKKVIISQTLTYIGYCNQLEQPTGLGVIYGSKQFYLGHFRQGSLQCYGRIVFQNGQIYHGQLFNGIFYGQGVYYNPIKNQSSILSTHRDQQLILDQHQGYICINISMSYFKYSNINNTGLQDDDCLRWFSQVIEKYYLKYYVEDKQGKEKDSSDRSEFGVSENNSNFNQFNSKNSYKYNTNTNNDNNRLATPQSKDSFQSLNKKKWLNFRQQQVNKINQNKNNFNKNQTKVSQFNNNNINNQQQQSQLQQLQRVYSLNKKQISHLRRQHLNQKQIQQHKNRMNHMSPNNKSYQQAYQKKQTLESDFYRLEMDRKLSLNDKKYNQKYVSNFQSLKVKENIDPIEQQHYNRKVPLNSNGQIPGILKMNRVLQNQQDEDQINFNNNMNNNNFNNNNNNKKLTFKSDTLNLKSSDSNNNKQTHNNNNNNNYYVDMNTNINNYNQMNMLKMSKENKQRKYSHIIQSINDISRGQSQISNLSMKVDGMLKKGEVKRKKIFI